MKRVSLFAFAAFGIMVGCSSSGGDTAASSTSSAPAATTTSGATPPAGASTTAAVDGKSLFAQNCSGCHGDEGKGGKKAPVLAGRHLDATQVATTVTSGKGRMPAFGKRLSKDQIDALGQYVSTL
jgi:alcohol dehydrogenase (cytochrome c)